jgi:hypothetical protein
MNHNEEIEYLKENDPITYYELTGNPTGSDKNSGCLGVWVLFVIGIIIGVIILG